MTVVGAIVVGWLALDGRDIGRSAESVAQLLIAAAVFGAAVYYLLGPLILEGIDYRGRGARPTSEIMLLVVPTAVVASALLTLIRT